MPLFACSACAKPLNVDDRLAGQPMNCPRCAAAIIVPALLTQATQPIAAAGNSPTLPFNVSGDSSKTPALESLSADPALLDILAPPESSDELGRLGAFRILKILGKGGMGVVFQAEDVKLERTVAVKAMLPGVSHDANAAKRFVREAKAMARIEHPHVARIYQVDEERGVPFLAMEFLKGESLDDCLSRDPVLSVPQIARIGREIAEGLAAAHALGLVHRDIKPANIWLQQPDALVKILDFGLARAESPDHQVTQSGMVVGTPSYMAPEQARGAAVDARTDLFALGVVLYLMTTGRPPFKGADAISTLVAVASDHPASPRSLNADVPPELDRIILKLLAKHPKDRFQTAVETIDALSGFERSQGFVSSTMPMQSGSNIAKPRRRGAVWIFGGLLLAGLCGASVFAWQYAGRAETGVKTTDPMPIAKGVEVVEKKPPAIQKATPTIVKGPPAFPVERLLSPDEEWSTPESLGPAINSGRRSLGAMLTSDERIIVFSCDGALKMGRRAKIEDEFTDVEFLPESINKKAGENGTMTGDGLLLAFSSDRPGSEHDDIWMSTRTSIDEPFGDPVRLPEPVNSTGRERAPVLSSDGLTLFVTAFGRNGIAHGEIVQFTRRSRNEPFTNETWMPAPINTPVFDVADWLSPDGRVFIATTMGEPPFRSRIFVRPTPDAPFAAPHFFGPPFVGSLNPARAWISHDGERLYFHSREVPGHRGEMRIWMCRRVPKSKG